MIGGFAEFERELVRVRTSEGRERAKARGVKLGRKPKLTLSSSARLSACATNWAGRCETCPQLQRLTRHDFEG